MAKKKDKLPPRVWPQPRRCLELKENFPVEPVSPEEDQCYQEIDQIYDYVRGMGPLPDTVKAELAAQRAEMRLLSREIQAQRRLSYPTIVYHIAPTKRGAISGSPSGGCSFSRQSTQPHTRAPVRSNSTGKLGIGGHFVGGYHHHQQQQHQHAHHPHHQHQGHREPLVPLVQLPKPKLYVKGGQKNLSQSRLLKYSKSPTMWDIPSLCPKLVEEGDHGHGGGDIALVSCGVTGTGLGGVTFNSTAGGGGHPGNHNNNLSSCKSTGSLSTSPLFNIRYKSLSDLHQVAGNCPSLSCSPQPPPLGGSGGANSSHWSASLSPAGSGPLRHFADTLDSSNSGGSRGQASVSASAGSKDPFKDPKPKARKLSRPKSLTKLFWDMAAAVTFDRTAQGNEFAPCRNSSSNAQSVHTSSPRSSD
ncbi:hypothetical protein HDE_09932 [Halotydeus destructor]|nr:hypothetical protein HDE_09932 [Halotydeus destructor]